MFTTIFTGVASIVSSWINRKQRIAEAKTQAEIENAGKIIDRAGWKDEFIVIVWSAPAIMAFVPGGQKYVEKGFEHLAQAPEWYLAGWLSISLAIYGLKPATKKLLEWRRKQLGGS